MTVKTLLPVLAALIISASGLKVGDRFNLWAYGSGGISGLPVFYSNGAAVIASFETASKTDNLVPLTFVASSGEGLGGFELTATPNTTAPVQNKATQSPPFQNVTLFIPAASSTDHDIGFTSDDIQADSVIAKGFLFAARTLLVFRNGRKEDGLATFIRAFPTETPGIWSLKWNVKGTNDGGVTVTLRDGLF